MGNSPRSSLNERDCVLIGLDLRMQEFGFLLIFRCYKILLQLLTFSLQPLRNVEAVLSPWAVHMQEVGQHLSSPDLENVWWTTKTNQTWGRDHPHGNVEKVTNFFLFPQLPPFLLTVKIESHYRASTIGASQK